MKPINTLEQRDIQAIRAYKRACTGGSVPGADSPVAKAAARAVKRQEAKNPTTDFILKALGEAPREPAKLPVPDNDAVARTRASLAGIGNVDLSGGASTIATDLDRWKDAERGRQVMNDPLFEEAMSQASIRAAKEGRRTTAADFNEALAKLHAERGPQPHQPPQPVVALLTGTAAKSISRDRYSVVPDSFRR